MTGTEIDTETQAQRIAARGREALLERMRTAYGDAAAAHADLISLDDERIEAMAQAAADRADGLQWRRALARVASDELGLTVAEALSHPVVARAQELVGAPSYEQSLAELIARPVPPPTPAAGIAGPRLVAESGEGETEPGAGMPEPEPPEPVPPLPEPVPEPPAPEPEPEPEPGPLVAVASGAELAQTHDDADERPSDELETVRADDVVMELMPEPDPIEYETEVYDVEASFAQERVPPAPVNPFATQTAHEAAAAQQEEFPAETGEHPAGDGSQGETPQPIPEEQHNEVVIPAIHLGGVANLPTKRDGLSVRLSADGLDIMQGERDIIGRLVWEEIEALEVPNLRVRRRSKQLRSRLVVRTPHGDASFEVPDASAEELRELVEPMMELYGRQ